MNKSTLVIACLATLLAGCATRPGTGPGSGKGDSYVPMVERGSAAPDAYEADVAACQRTARSYTFNVPDDHREALFVLNTAVLGGIAAGVSGVAQGLAAGGVALGYLNGFEYFVYSPQRAVFYQRQETAIANCMARRGYANTDPGVNVTWRPSPTFIDANLRRTGVDTYNAEKLAKTRSCSAMPFANLVAKGPGFESYSMRCDSGQVLAVRCEFGNCRAV